MRLRPSGHLTDRVLFLFRIKTLEQRWRFETWHFCALFGFGLDDACDYEVQVKVGICIAKKGTLYEGYSLVQITWSVAVTVTQNLYEQHINYSINSKYYMLVAMTVSEANLQTVLGVIARLEFIILVVLPGLGSKFSHKFQT
jgi:hypothetical protein